MSTQNQQIKILALAIFEIRVLLSSYLGSMNEGDMSVRLAAHLAYALHNDALAALEGNEFDIEGSLNRIQIVDKMLGAEFTERFKKAFEPEDSQES